jgi:copper oxidase (laccase) domain-containing protein
MTQTAEILKQALYSPGMLSVMSDPRLAPSAKWRDGLSRSEIIEARQAAWEAHGLSLAHSIWARQVHGDCVWVVNESDMGSGAYHNAEVDADAIICRAPHPLMNLVIKGADCPILGVRCGDTGAIGVVHAGVAGQKMRIIATTIEAMVHHGASRQDLEVFVGPFISHHHYRHPWYGDTVRFFYERACAYKQCDFWHVDQEEVIRRQLYSAGIHPEHTYFDGRCTYADPHLISHTKTREENPGVEHAAFQRGNNVMIRGVRTLT